MAQYNVGPTKTFAAGADLSAAGNECKAVKLTAAKTVGLVAAVGDLVIGFLEPGQRPRSGEDCAVRLVNASGTVKAQAGAAIAVGAEVKLDGTGRVVTIGTPSAGDKIVGVALEAASAAGNFIEVLLNPRTAA